MKKTHTPQDIMVLVEVYAQKYTAVDGWSGKVKASSVLKEAYAARDAIGQALEQGIEPLPPSTVNPQDIMALVEVYAQKYMAVDGWSGKVKASSVLKEAYDAHDAIAQALKQGFEPLPSSTVNHSKNSKSRP